VSLNLPRQFKSGGVFLYRKSWTAVRISGFISTNSPAIFDAMSWPSTIPYDLMLSLEASQTQEEWWLAFKAWAKSHRLRLKLQWMSELARNLSKLDDWRSRPHNSDKWGVI
jgi:hypothetical protein